MFPPQKKHSGTESLTVPLQPLDSLNFVSDTLKTPQRVRTSENITDCRNTKHHNNGKELVFKHTCIPNHGSAGLIFILRGQISHRIKVNLEANYNM